MTPEQKEIMQFVISSGGEITKQNAVSYFQGDYYNKQIAEKYIGDRLSRMVNANLLIRIKPGVFKIGSGKKSKPSTISTGQKSLF